MLLHAAEDDYLNQNMDDAVARLSWLKSVLDAASMQAAVVPSFAATRSRTYTLLRQMQLGLGYYGQYGNYIPLLSVDYFTKTLKSLIDYGSSIEASYNAYTAQAATSAAQMSALKSTRQSTDANISTLKAHLTDLLAQQVQLQEDITTSLIEINNLWEQLFQSDQSFRNEVAAQHQGCSFAQLVTLAASIAILVSTGGTAIAAIGPALAAVQGGAVTGADGKVITGDFAAFSARVGRVATAGKDTESFVAAFNTVKGQLLPPQAPSVTVPSLPSDDAKIFATASDFDRELQPYLSLPTAKAYQALMHTFVTAAQARNNKIMEYNANVVGYDNTITTIQSLQQQDSDLDTKIAATNDPSLIEAQLYMAGANRDTQARIVRALFDLDRSIRFYSLDTSKLVITDFSIATLESTASAQISQYSQVRQQLGIPPQQFRDKQVAIGQYITTVDMVRFRERGIVTFTIGNGEATFANYSHVLASRIWVTFKGPQSPPIGFQAAFKNHGRSLLFDDSSQAHVFSHVTIPVSYELGADASVVVNGTMAPAGGDYMGVSPYGPWTLTVLNMSSTVLRTITDVVVHFDGFARSRPQLQLSLQH